MDEYATSIFNLRIIGLSASEEEMRLVGHVTLPATSPSQLACNSFGSYSTTPLLHIPVCQ